MDDSLNHTQVTPQRHTTEFMKLLLTMSFRYFGRAIFGFAESAGLIGSRTANKLTGVFAGVLAGGMTFAMARSTYNDIWNVYSEAVALEFDKKPSQVTFGDLRRSENKLVKETLGNFTWFNAVRILGVSGFFASLITKELPFKADHTDKGGNIVKDAPMVLADVPGGDYFGMGTFAGIAGFHEFFRKTTSFERITKVINEKLSNSSLGNDIAISDLVSIYQGYAEEHDRDARLRGVADLQRWDKFEPVLLRCVYLLNHSYRARRNERELGMRDPQETFQFPKFLHLVGQGLLDPDHVAESHLYVEVINKYGMGAVKECKTALAQGATIEQCIEKYPVQIPGYEFADKTNAPEKDILPTRQFTQNIAPKNTQESFAANVEAARKTTPERIAPRIDTPDSLIPKAIAKPAEAHAQKLQSAAPSDGVSLSL